MVELDLSRSVGITEIGFDAFRNCTSLTGIFIPSSVTQIAQTAFEGCTSLTKFTVDERNHYFSSDPTGRMLLSTSLNVHHSPVSTSQKVSVKSELMLFLDAAH